MIRHQHRALGNPRLCLRHAGVTHRTFATRPKRLVRTLRKYRTFELQIAGQTIHAASPLPPEVTDLITRIEAD